MSDWIDLLGPATAYAQESASPPPGGAFVTGFMPFILIFILFYFLLIRPQMRRQKEHRRLLEELKKGDKVVTSGGLLGTVVALTKEVATLQVADQVRLKVMRQEIMAMQGDTAAEPDEPKEPAKGAKKEPRKGKG